MGRTWTASEWQEYLLGHPVMSRLVERLVWVENPGTEGARPFRPDGGALVDADDEDVELGEGRRSARARRPARSGGDGRLDGPPVGLRGRPALRAARRRDARRPRGSDGDRRPQGLVLRQLLHPRACDEARLLPLAGRGRRVVQRVHQGFHERGIVVQIEFTGSFVPEENIPAAVTALTFERTGRGSGGDRADRGPAARPRRGGVPRLRGGGRGGVVRPRLGAEEPVVTRRTLP